MVSRGAVAKRREIPGEKDSLEETGGFISSIPALESADSLGPELIAFIKDVIKLDCVRDCAKQRLTALLQKHNAL